MIFVDTSFWVALRNRGDGQHDGARKLLSKHGRQQLLTSNHVRGETWTYLRRKAGHSSAVDFLDALQNSSRVETATLDSELERESLQWLRQHNEREYSFVDATSFALMRHRRVSVALAFDGDFSAAGFTELRL